MGVPDYLYELNQMVDKGGPDVFDYDKLRVIADGLDNISLEDEGKLYEIFKSVLQEESIIGHTFLKPRGYAGDFRLIDKIHMKETSQDPRFKKWDEYFHEADSSIAVRNRKSYFIKIIQQLANTLTNPKVLNLGSGPCRDVFEYYQSSPTNRAYIDCVDMDKDALEYASGLCDNYYNYINYINQNVFRYKPTNKYNIIWSAGLFDYFSDKLFIRLVSRLYQFLEKEGELVIGNFSIKNPGKTEMEVYGKWFLNHRSEEQLISLALKAGIHHDCICVQKEQTGVNLFLHLIKQL